MTPSLKKLCIFGLATGIGKMILAQNHTHAMSDTDRLTTIENAIELKRAGQEAIDHCQANVDNNRIKHAKQKIDQICRDHADFDISVMLSFLFLGLNDLSLKCTDKARIKVVEDAALNFIMLYDPNLEDDAKHSQAMDDYERWIS